MCVSLKITNVDVDVEMFHWISENFDVLVAQQEMSGECSLTSTNVQTKFHNNLSNRDISVRATPAWLKQGTLRKYFLQKQFSLTGMHGGPVSKTCSFNEYFQDKC